MLLIEYFSLEKYVKNTIFKSRIMKQALLLLISFLALSVQAQLSFEPTEVNESFNPEIVFDLENHLDLTNGFSDDQQFIWSVTQESGPSEWSFYVCDLNKCYGPGTSFVTESGANTILAGDTKAVFFHLLPNSTEGQGSYTFKLTPVFDTNTTLATITMNFDSKIVIATKEDAIENLNVFPNPVNDYFTLENPSKIASQIVIYDVLGKKVKTFDAIHETNFYVGDIQTGRYFARIFDESGKALKVVRLVKR